MFDCSRRLKSAILKSFVLRTPLYTYEVLYCSQRLPVGVIFTNIYRIQNQTTISKCRSLQSCPILWPHGLYSLPGYSVHGTLQARMPEWVAISYSRGSSPFRDQTGISCKSPALQADSLLRSHWGSLRLPRHRSFPTWKKQVVMRLKRINVYYRKYSNRLAIRVTVAVPIL